MKILKNILKYTVVFGVMIYLLYDVFMQIDESSLAEGQSRFGYILNVGSSANFFMVFLSIFANFLSHVIRAERWRITLEPLSYHVGLKNSFWAVINSYFINLVVPRGGEVARPIAIKRTEGVPLEAGLGTVVTERVIDLLFLVICIFSVFLFNIDEILSFFTNSNERGVEGGSSYILYLLGLSVVAGIAGVGLLYFFQRRLFLKLFIKGKGFLFGLKDGLLSVFKLEKKVLFVVYSFLIWVLYFLMLYFVMLAFDLTADVSFENALTVFVIGSIAMAIPIPGGTGPYHVMVGAALVTICGVQDKGMATAFVTIFHGMHNLFLILIGGIGLIAIERAAKTYKNAIKG